MDLHALLLSHMSIGHCLNTIWEEWEFVEHRGVCQYPHLFVGFQHTAVYFNLCVPGYLKHLNFLVTLDVIKAWLI